jgi:hypothetical protein
MRLLQARQFLKGIRLAFLFMETIFTVDNFLTVAPGEPFRLLPFGRIVKGGKTRNFTPEMAAKFQLPHFKPAIKLGSHDDTTPAGGHIVGLEVRNDGLYAIPELNEQGMAAFARGDFRYHSPEIAWEGGLENPTTGAISNTPLIIGTALLHTPHLGEQTALYSIEPYGGNHMDMVQVPTSIWDKILARVFPPEPAAPPPTPENYTAELSQKTAEIDKLSAQVATMQAQMAHQAKVAKFAAEFSNTSLAGDVELHSLLAGLPDEQAAPLVTKFKGVSEQVRVSNLTSSPGATGGTTGGDPIKNIEALTAQRMKEKKIDYNAAILEIARENPDAFKGLYEEVA